MKQFLLLVAAASLFSISAFAQAPNFSYSPAINNLTIGTPVTITPITNAGGGAVPATQYGKVTTIAGTGTSGYFNSNTATLAQFNTPYTMVGDAAGNLYVADANNNAIRMITPAGVVSTFAGSDVPGNTGGFVNGTGTTAQFNNPQGIAIDANGTNLYVADFGNDAIREINIASGAVTTFFSQVGLAPTGINFDASGNLLVATQGQLSQIMSISPSGVLTSLAGSQFGYMNGTGPAAQFAQPEDVQADASGNLFVADYLNNAIRKIAPGNVVTTLAGSNVPNNTGGYADGVGTAAMFDNPTGLALGSGNIIYVADLYNNDIRRVLPDGTVSTVAGNQTPGAADGTGAAASFNQPVDLYIDNTGTGYIADAGNGDIRKIILTGYTIDKPLPAGLSFDSTTGTISGIPTAPLTTTTYTITAYNAIGYASTAITLSSGSVTSGTAPIIAYSPATNYVPVGSPFTITPTNSGGAVPATVYGKVTTIAGSGTTGGFQNGTGTAAQFNIPYAVVGDGAGNFYVADANNNAIRIVTSGGVVTTLAGTGASGPANNGPIAAAQFNNPQGIAMDAAGNLYVSDYGNHVIRKISADHTTVSNFYQYDSTFGPAGLCFDNSGNLIVADEDESLIIRVAPNGTGTVITGTIFANGYVNGNVSSALFANPEDVQVDAAGNIFVADFHNNVIREITPAGMVTTLAGNTTAGYADGPGTTAMFNNLTGIALGSGSIIYVADWFNNNIRKVTSDGTVSFVAGSPTHTQLPLADGTGADATFSHPVDLYIDNTGTGWVADARNNAIRMINLTGYTIDKPLPAGLTFDQTTGNISGTLTAPLIGTTYTVTAYNAYGYASTTVTLSSYNNWTGGTSDWATASNWSQNVVPGAGNVAQIGIVPYAAGTAQPELAGSTTISSVRFGTNNTPVLTIDAAQTLTVTDSLTVVAASTATINGPGTINVGGTSVINTTASLTASLNAVIALAPAATLTNSGTFTLASDVNGSASIAAIPAGASITGNVSVQRFIQGSGDLSKRGYRLLSSSVYTGTDAQAGGAHVSDLQYLATYTHISGAGETANGFNVTSTANPSIYLFREDVAPPPSNSTVFTTGYNWKGVAQINSTPNNWEIGTQFRNDAANLLDTLTSIPVGNAVLYFFRGDINQAVLPIAPPNDVTLTHTGTLNTGTIPVRLWFSNTGNNLGNNFSWTNPTTHTGYSTSTSTLTAGFTLVGNPYPCTINWEKYNMNGANSSIYGSGGLPQIIYVFDVQNKQYEFYMPALNGDSTSVNPGIPGGPAASNMIASGQGFFVVASAPGQTLTFRETAKTSTQPIAASVNMLMGTPKQLATVTPKPIVRLKLSLDSINTDEIVFRLDNNAKPKFVINEDALDIGGSEAPVSLSSFSSDSIRLALNTLPFPGQQQLVIPLLADATASGTYHLAATQINNLPALYTVWLKDAYTADSIQMKLNTSYQFSIDKSNPATFGSNRFILVIRQDPAMAYQLLSFTASKMPAAPQVQVVWKTANEQNYTNFTVERSIDDGKTFDVLGGLQGTGAGKYSLLDKNPITGQNLYRLKQEDINNTITYSNIVTIQYSDLSNNNLDNLNLFPNPASSSVNLAIIATPDQTATYNIRFVNSSGLVVKQVNSSQPSWQGNISSLKPGTYFVNVFSNKDQSLVGRTKFVKL